MEQLFLTPEEISMLKELNKGYSWGVLSRSEEDIIDSLEKKGLAYRTGDNCCYGLFHEGVEFLEKMEPL